MIEHPVPVYTLIRSLLAEPLSFYLDESDPDLVVLRRQDASFVAAFSSSGITKEGVVDAAKEDYRALAGGYLASRAEEDRGQQNSA